MLLSRAMTISTSFHVKLTLLATLVPLRVVVIAPGARRVVEKRSLRIRQVAPT